MESAPLFVLGSVLHVRVGVVLLIAGNNMRLRMGLETKRFDDPSIAIQTGVGAMRILIKQDYA
jgi:uridine phosphorylase